MSQLNRLHQVNLYQVKDMELEYFFDHVTTRSSFSLIIDSSEKRHERTLSLISSAIPRFKLSKLCLNNLNNLTDHISWINECGLECLSINTCDYRQCLVILRQLVHLRTAIMKNCHMRVTDNNIVDSNSSRSLSPMVTSLIIYDQSLSIKDLEWILSQFPRLVHLKLDSRRTILDSVFDGYYWEQLIQNILPTLKTFQIFFSYDFAHRDNAPNLHTLIHAFQTSFWIEKKRWFIICDYVIQSNTIRIYTIPAFIDISHNPLRLELSSMNNIYRLTRPSPKKIVDNTIVNLRNGEVQPIGMFYIVEALTNFSCKTINALNISTYVIKDKEIKYLINTLLDNKVIFTCHLYLFSLFFYLDTHYIKC